MEYKECRTFEHGFLKFLFAPALGRGIGAALLNACEEQLEVERIRLCVRFSNTPAIDLYERLEYVRIDVWRRYYADGEDAIVFEKVL